ncbi:methyltransferase domain-containing protein [Antarcticibacterium flavum]|uniref:Methyltransferase domain-containing protein n=1 Tax=Antarcticibacterium flavum TaxID=2058175 RepID=A0A5B7WYD0_9FLAO|nr:MULTISPECIES: methyltransferase domain-containing protein [Antarcticibacterium]MCM4158872.1 methyltransferase [Antarcticibacterium sp. W02-3]QCY68129.1 methyltransferase domain-containing protein [Antarcticibacterium flavum]
MKKINTSKRTNDSEIMDDFDLQGPELEVTLDDLDKVNKWLGGNKITLQGVKKLLLEHPGSNPISILDIGCGNGSMLREIANWGRAAGYNLSLTGVDANSHAIEIAERKSEFFPEINYETLNIFSNDFRSREYDIVLCTLTLHHFKDPEIEEIMTAFYRQARLGIVINDLHRSRQAYILFKAFCKVFINNKIARDDGLTSILRGFKKKELKKFAAQIPAAKQEIKWKWAYRYQWIIQKPQAK